MKNIQTAEIEKGGRAALTNMVVPRGAAPVDAAAAIRRAGELGCRSVVVLRSLAPLAADALKDTACRIATGADGRVGWLGEFPLRWVSTVLAGCRADEFVFHAEGGALASDPAVATLLRQATALCHAHGVTAGVSIVVSGLTEGQVRAAVRQAIRASADGVTLASTASTGVARSQVAAAVGEARGRIGICVDGTAFGAETAEDVWTPCDLGATSVNVLAA